MLQKSTLAWFALIRRYRANCLQFSFHHPGEGFFRLCKLLFALLPSYACKSTLYLTVRNRRSSLPLGGEGVAIATDEGEMGECTFLRMRQICYG